MGIPIFLVLYPEKTKQTEPILNLQVPSEGLELMILLHTYTVLTLRYHLLMIIDDCQLKRSLYHFINNFQFFFTRIFFLDITFENFFNYTNSLVTATFGSGKKLC